MANKVFSSYSNGKNKDVDHQLIIEIGNRHLACYLKSQSKQTIRDFELFKFNKGDFPDFNRVYTDMSGNSSILNKPNIDTRVFLNNETSLLVPSSGFSKESAADYLKLVYGEKTDCRVLVDDLHEHGIYNVYWVPEEWIEVLSQHLNNLETFHSYSKITEQAFEKNASRNVLKVIFYDDYIIVTLFADQKFHFIQTFTYQSPQDILYYLLSIGQRFNLSTDSTYLQLSGMIDVKSVLFYDLKKYFKKLSVEEMEGSNVQINFEEFPKHNFVPFFNLSK